MVDKNICGIYIFTDTSTTYKFEDDNKRCINLISSLNLNLQEKEFILLFKLCLLNMSKKFSLCLIDDMGNNNMILNSIIPKYNCLTISETSYYFYNFAIKPLDKEKTCIIV